LELGKIVALCSAKLKLRTQPQEKEKQKYKQVRCLLQVGVRSAEGVELLGQRCQ